MRTLLLLFVLVPIAEIWVLIAVGEQIGALPTIGIVLLTAMIGVALLRQQGVSTLIRVQQRLEVAEVPAREVFEGVIIAVGGALLLTPGFITDAFGFACLIPVTRRLLIRQLLSRIHILQEGGHHGPPGKRPSPSGRGKTIDGEYRRED
ncbi:MAG: FxsA family protein [Exilibacterium sp.]